MDPSSPQRRGGNWPQAPTPPTLKELSLDQRSLRGVHRRLMAPLSPPLPRGFADVPTVAGPRGSLTGAAVANAALGSGLDARPCMGSSGGEFVVGVPTLAPRMGGAVPSPASRTFRRAAPWSPGLATGAAAWPALSSVAPCIGAPSGSRLKVPALDSLSEMVWGSHGVAPNPPGPLAATRCSACADALRTVGAASSLRRTGRLLPVELLRAAWGGVGRKLGCSNALPARTSAARTRK